MADRENDPNELRHQQEQAQRLNDLAGKVRGVDLDDVNEGRVRDLSDQMSAREIEQRDALDAMRGQGAAHRDGRVTPDVPDHLNNPDATVEDHIKDLERRANTAKAADEDLMRAARGERDAAGHSEPGSRPADPGQAADAADALHGPTSPTMPTDPANDRLDPQAAVEPADAPKTDRHPEAAYGAPVTAREKNAVAADKAKVDAAKDRADKKG